MYNVLEREVSVMFLKHLREQIVKECNEIKEKQAAVSQDISAEQKAFDKEWNKWTTPKKLTQKPNSN